VKQVRVSNAHFYGKRLIKEGFRLELFLKIGTTFVVFVSVFGFLMVKFTPERLIWGVLCTSETLVNRVLQMH